MTIQCGNLIAPALRENKAGAPVAIGKLEDIPVGQFHPFSFTLTKVNGWERTASNYGGYILRKSESPADILVLSSRCTHLSCTVNWNEATSKFTCPCHDASFDAEGKVLVPVIMLYQEKLGRRRMDLERVLFPLMDRYEDDDDDDEEDDDEV